jgi:hypothetical protein
MKAQPRERRMLKRPKSATPIVAEPLSLFHVGLGCLGVLYESQLVYLKHELDKIESCDRDAPLVATLEGAHALAVEILSRLTAGEPVDFAAFPDLLAANGRALEGLAAEGRDLLERLGAHWGEP